MIFTTHFCGRCVSNKARKNGSSNGRPKYQCKVWAYEGYLQLVPWPGAAAIRS